MTDRKALLNLLDTHCLPLPPALLSMMAEFEGYCLVEVRLVCCFVDLKLACFLSVTLVLVVESFHTKLVHLIIFIPLTFWSCLEVKNYGSDASNQLYLVAGPKTHNIFQWTWD